MTFQRLHSRQYTEDQKQTLIKVYLSLRHENEDRLVSPPLLESDIEDLTTSADS